MCPRTLWDCAARVVVESERKMAATVSKPCALCGWRVARKYTAGGLETSSGSIFAYEKGPPTPHLSHTPFPPFKRHVGQRAAYEYLIKLGILILMRHLLSACDGGSARA
jgi:hypothetical protein